MRKLKFRAWQKKYNEMWFDGGHMNLAISLDGTIGSPDAYYGTDQSEDFEIMQYTGLKDKNGVEIYEGDIVTHEQYVIWGKLSKHMGVVSISSKNGVMVGYDSIGGNVEVIGNIYENLELVGGQEWK